MIYFLLFQNLSVGSNVLKVVRNQSQTVALMENATLAEISGTSSCIQEMFPLALGTLLENTRAGLALG